ncbi:MAG: homoserine dehydrogenase [Oceanicaulis sp.]
MTSAPNDLAPNRRLCVLKFGGSVLTTETSYAEAGTEIYRHVRDGEKAIVIVSALAGETDLLLSQADRMGADASAEMTARLARLGEYRSAAMMGLVLARMGVRAKVLDPHEIALEAEGDPLDADLARLDEDALAEAIEKHEAVIVPGFTAGHARHGAATLGRGGTDLTAVFFAAKAGAQRARLIKDVDGVYTDDPAKDASAKRYDRLDYDTALACSRGLIQPKAIEAARAAGVQLEIAAMGAGEASCVAPGPAVIGRAHAYRPLRVALLGCGAVGSGVLDHLKARPDLFELNPVLVRRPERRDGDPRALFTDDIGRSLAGGPDLVVEVMGGADDPAAVMQGALEAGADVVTANKAAVAKHYDALHASAKKGGARLEYAAAVGGGVVMVETVRRLKPHGLAAVEGVMNGTANFILSRLEAGADFDAALTEAQAKGFAEADPSADVDGHDAADKLSILIREAFGADIPPHRIPKMSLSEITAQMSAAAHEDGKVYKQIARARRTAGGAIDAEVVIEPISRGHAFAGAVNEENRCLITASTGRIHALYGKGAGRWPTAAAVFADIMDIARHRASDGAAPGRAAAAGPSPRPAAAHLKRA